MFNPFGVSKPSVEEILYKAIEMFDLSEYIPSQRLEEFCRKHHISKLALYGSALKNRLKADSDIDMLVEFDNDHIPGLMDIAGMEIELSEMIGRKVDLRTPDELSRYFTSDVLSKAKVEYAA